MTPTILLNPAYMGALALAGIPILVHLIRRRRVRVVPWAAWDFLLQSKRRNRRRLRVEQLVLLLLRMLIVALAVLAFCRPLFRSLGLPLSPADARVHAAIVIDNSYSMGYRQNGRSDFDRARQVADDLLTTVLKPGDSASVVLLSSKPQPLLAEPTLDLSRAREAVRKAQLSDAGTDYGAVAAYCVELLRADHSPAREVYWITDSQRAGFVSSSQARTLAAWRALAATARITWIDVAEPARDNLSVQAPTFSRELVTPQAPVRIEAAVNNDSRTARSGLLVTLSVDGRAAGSSRVDVPAHGTARASFVYLFDKPGTHTGTVQLSQPDGLDRDNTAWFSTVVRDRLRTLIVDPRPASDPSQDEAFYLATALAPLGSAEGGSSGVQATVHPGASLAGVDLRAFDAVVVTGVTDMGASGRAALEEYVRNGGGLLLFPGATTDSARVNASLGAGDGLLPARLGARRQLTDTTAVSLDPASIAHPALAIFRETRDIDLGSARFTTTFDLTPLPEPGTRVMCRFTDGRPALIESLFGQGKVILGGGDAGISGSNLPYKPAFVPLVHQLVAYLAAGPQAQHNITVGGRITARFDVSHAGKAVRVMDPSGHTTLGKSALGADGVVFSTSPTERAGIYRIGVAGVPSLDAFAVNLPPGEADLASADEAQVRAGVGAVPMQFAHIGENLAAIVRRSRRGVEVWRPLVAATIVLLFLEGGLAWRYGRRG